jgi:hypothetical protein
MIDMVKINNTEYAVGRSPFLRGGSAVFVNFTAGALIVQGAQTSGGTYTTYVTVPLSGMIEGSDLPPFIRVSTAADVYVLA